MTPISARGLTDQQINGAATQAIQMRMDLVMDAYLTGAAEALKLIHGDMRPEPWEKFDWETRLTDLLETYKLKRTE